MRRLCALMLLAVMSGLLFACRTTSTREVDTGLHARADPRVIERGMYLVLGPGHCASCHGDPTLESQMRAGQEVPLSGGRVFQLGVAGSIVAPNLTSDRDTGIGALTDSSVVRALRYGISRQGRTLAPFMSLANTSDEDLVAILSYLRSLAPVVHQVRPTRLSWVGAFGLRYFLAPQEPTQKPSKSVMPARSAEYGRYLANTIANCHGCHTRRSKLTGAFTGLPFAGGMTFEEPTGKFVAPDLRQAVDAPLACKSEHDFIAKFRVPGRGLSGSPMPWEAFARMTDDDLGSIYLYLKTLPIGLARMPVALPAAARQSARDPAVASLRRWLHFEPAGNAGCSERSPRH